MSRNVLGCYGAPWSLKEALSEPQDRRETSYICGTCSSFLRLEKDYHVCDICVKTLNQTIKVEVYLTYPVKKFIELQKARGVLIKFHLKPFNNKVMYTKQ